MKSILIFSDWFTPAYKAGGPIQSVKNLSLQLSCAYHVFIYTSAYDLKSSEVLHNIELNTWTLFDQNVKVFYQSEKRYSKMMVIEFIRPDYIYLNSIFSKDFTIDILGLGKSLTSANKIFLAPRGMLKPSALNKKYLKKWVFLTWAKLTGLYEGITFHATNEQEKSEINNVFNNAKVIVVDNLPPVIKKGVIPIIKHNDDLRMICIGRIHPIKNINFLLESLISVKSTIQLTILGSVEDADYKKSCEQIIERLPSHIEVEFIAEKPHEEVEGLINKHHLMILPTLGENYGHAIIESLAVGRPVIISDQTPWKNLQEFNSGWELSLNDKGLWIGTIEEAASWDQKAFDAHCLGALDYARVHTKVEDLVKKYIDMFSV